MRKENETCMVKKSGSRPTTLSKGKKGGPLRRVSRKNEEPSLTYTTLFRVQRMGSGSIFDKMYANLLYYIVKDRVPDRPNRTEPRARKRRPKNYQLLNKPRKEFKEIRHRNKYTAGLS